MFLSVWNQSENTLLNEATFNLSTTNENSTKQVITECSQFITHDDAHKNEMCVDIGIDNTH